MEEPTAILKCFRQFPEDFERNLFEDNASWGVAQNAWPCDKTDNLNVLFQSNEKELDDSEDYSSEDLTSSSEETQNELERVPGDAQRNNFEVASDAFDDDFSLQKCNLKNRVDVLQSDKICDFEMAEEFDPLVQPPTSPLSNINTQMFKSNEHPPGSTVTRATFSPSSPTDKKPQIPALFSGLRVLRKGVVGPDHDRVSQFTAVSENNKTQGTFLDQISQLLSREEGETKQNELNEIETRSSADAVFDAFKSFFTPKPLKIDSSEKVDLEAVRRRIRSEREQLKTFFEKTDVSTEEETNGKSDDAEDKTPGRLQAVWPPLQEEEKVGLKYTEAEHQASLLQLKRQCNEDLEKLQEDYAEELSRLKEESDDCVSRLQFTIIELQSRLSQSVSRRHGEVRDASVSTSDETKTFRNAGIQTDCELMKPSHNEDGGHDSDLRFISENWSEQNNNPGFSDHRSFTCQTHPIIDPVSRVSQCHHSNVPPPPPGPPPPPPPLPESGFCPLSLSLDTAPRKPFVEPSRPMKPLYWARIQLQQNNEQTVWSSLEEAKINTCDFEDLFCKTATQTKRKPLSEVYGRKTKTKKIVKLLDQKRSQAVGILISSLHLDMKDIERAVLTVDPSVVDVDTIEALYENKAQPDELGKIKQHYETSNEEDVKLLDKPEQFLYELSQISDFAGRAQCIIFQSSFLDGIVSIRHKLRTVSSVCEELSQRQSVKQVMGLVLALGNHMNGGSRTRGQADGFGLDILPKLKDVKSRDNRINLGDYLVSYYLQNVDKNAGTDRSVFPLPEPQDVFLAAQVKFEELHKDLRQLSHDLTQCEKNIQNVCSNSPEEHLQPFKDKMEAFVLSARKEHGEASYQLLTIEKSFQDLVAYFGLQAKAGDKEVTPGYFFMLWFEFCSDFKVRWKRESKNVSKERLKEAQMSVKRITGEKKVETRKTNANSLKERLRQKEATLSST